MKKYITIIAISLACMAFTFAAISPSTVYSSALGVTNTPVGQPTDVPPTDVPPTATIAPTEPPAPTATPVIPTAKPPSHSDDADPTRLPETGSGQAVTAFEPAPLGKIILPSLGVTAPIYPIPWTGMDWDLDGLGQNAGWLVTSAGLNQPGNKVIIGHLDLADRLPGPFFDLKEMKTGDQVVVQAGGMNTLYRVTGSTSVDSTDTQYVRADYPADLTLITCLRGSWDPSRQEYMQRLVVTLRQVVSEPVAGTKK